MDCRHRTSPPILFHPFRRRRRRCRPSLFPPCPGHLFSFFRTDVSFTDGSFLDLRTGPLSLPPTYIPPGECLDFFTPADHPRTISYHARSLPFDRANHDEFPFAFRFTFTLSFLFFSFPFLFLFHADVIRCLIVPLECIGRPQQNSDRCSHRIR